MDLEDYTLIAILDLEMTRRDVHFRLCILLLLPCNLVSPDFSFVTFKILLYYLSLVLVFALICNHNVILLPLSGWGVTIMVSETRQRETRLRLVVH